MKLFQIILVLLHFTLSEENDQVVILIIFLKTSLARLLRLLSTFFTSIVATNDSSELSITM